MEGNETEKHTDKRNWMKKYLLTECAAWKASERERVCVCERETQQEPLLLWKMERLGLKRRQGENTVATEKQQNKSYSFIFLMMKNDE